MCFSAGASFIASGGIGALAAGSFIRAKKRELLLAAIPLVFALQQLIEGFQWLTVKPSIESVVLGYAFLFFAFLFWPTYIPFVAWRLEQNKKRREFLTIFLILGVAVSLYLLAILILYPLTVQVISHHIAYHIPFPLREHGVLIYIATVTFAPILSTNRYFKWFGLAVLFSVLISWQFYYAAFTSVWCFFAAILSGGIWFYLGLQKRPTAKK